MPNPPQPWTSPTPHSKDRIRTAAVYCSDGRFGEQFDDLCHNALDLPRYDRLAVPGGAACLAGHFSAHREEHAVEQQLKFLIEVHEIERVVLIAHQDCAYYTHRLNVHTIDLHARQLDDLARATRHVRNLDANLRVDAFFAALDADQVTFNQIDV